LRNGFAVRASLVIQATHDMQAVNVGIRPNGMKKGANGNGNQFTAYPILSVSTGPVELRMKPLFQDIGIALGLVGLMLLLMLMAI
jgi:hypothetical protein